ncbi:MAG: permease-like cell division protein FtsX [Cytophagales bacterium]|nr:permease-like cell division protein FtsX [Cytophagales bacterium]
MAQNSRKTFGSYPYLSIVLSSSFTLFFLGLFGLLLLSGKELKENLQENVEIQIFLKNHLQENHRLQLAQWLAESAFCRKKNDTASIQYIPKDVAAKKFIAETGADFREFLGENPLRDAYLVKIADGFQSSEKLKAIKKSIERRAGVFEANYIESLTGAINKNLRNISILLLAFFVLLTLLVSLLIHNTMKLSLYSQRFLIRSMQLVGAKAGFIYRPFLFKSIGYGFFAGLLSAALTHASWLYAAQRIPELQSLLASQQQIYLYAGLVLSGVLICFWSTYHAVRKYLRMSLDELY